MDGKRVPLSWTDVRSSNGVIRRYAIRSKAIGKLELWRTWQYGDGKPTLVARYQIVADWKPRETKLRVEAGKSDDLGPYRWYAHYAGLRTDLQALAFTVKWREHARAFVDQRAVIAADI